MTLTEQLAHLVGFHKNYINCFGENVHANENALKSLLTAMGYDLSSEQTITASIDTLQDRIWQNMLPSCHIVKLEDTAPVIEFSIALTAEVQTLTWQISCEHQQVIDGSVTLSELHFVGEHQIDDIHYNKYQLPLPCIDAGYHQLNLSYAQQQSQCHLIYAPKTCYSPKEASAKKVWGYAAQLYSLKSDSNWGIGDFSDLKALVLDSVKQGVSAIGLNPLHPLFQNNPAHCSPYSPTSRCLLNTIYIDVQQVPYFEQLPELKALITSDDFTKTLQHAKQSTLIDYPAVAHIKQQALTLLFDYFYHHDLPEKSNFAIEYQEFKSKNLEDLTQLALFEALYEHFRTINSDVYGWTQWPEEYKSPNSSAVKTFAKAHEQRIEYFIYLQWLAHRQLTDVANTAQQAGMPIGLYLDLAVGCDGSGVDVWAEQDVYVAGASVGAPPDALNTLGQNWGLTPINPVAMQEQGYKPLIKALRSNMQYAGALRIDHILGLMRQYWVAPGMKADEGIYITFPLDDILRIIALESRRENCVVIGEDLGTVPAGFSDIMNSAGLLSYKVLYFETWESGLFKRPEEYSEYSMVTVSTHDLPTLAGWWTGRDLQWRQTLNLYPNEAMGEADRAGRVENRQRLLAALIDMQVLDNNEAPQTAPAAMNHALTIAVQEYLAKANSYIQLIPLEDALEIIEQVNIPGTTDEHPNWRQKLPVSVNEFGQQTSVQALVEMMNKARPTK